MLWADSTPFHFPGRNWPWDAKFEPSIYYINIVASLWAIEDVMQKLCGSEVDFDLLGFPTLLQGCRSWPVELECYLPRQALKRAFVFYLMYTGSWNRFFNLLLFFNTSVQSPCLNFGLKASRQRIKHPTHFPICFLEVKKQKKVLYWISQDCRLIWEWGN